MQINDLLRNMMDRAGRQTNGSAQRIFQSENNEDSNAGAQLGSQMVGTSKLTPIGGEEYESNEVRLNRRLMLSKMVHDFDIDEQVALFALY